jgi:hypothetical protein
MEFLHFNMALWKALVLLCLSFGTARQRREQLVGIGIGLVRTSVFRSPKMLMQTGEITRKRV